MQNFKLMSTLRLITFIVSAVLAVASIWPAAANAQEPDQNLASQLSELQAKVARLEAALNQKTSGGTAAAAMPSGKGNTQNKTAGATPSQRVSAKYQNCIQCHQTRPPGPLPASHFESPGGNAKGTAEPGPADPSGTAAPQAPAPDKGMAKMGADKGMGMGMGMEGKDKGKMGGGMGMGMMEKMDGMMGMMEKMMGGMSGMGGGAMQPGKGAPAAGGMGMKDDGMDEMAPMPQSQGAPASGGMSGMGGASSAPANAQNGVMEKMDKMMGLMEKMISAGAMQPKPGAPHAGGMSGRTPPTDAESKLMEKMDRLMGLMEKMIGGGAMQPAQTAPAMAPMPMM